MRSAPWIVLCVCVTTGCGGTGFERVPPDQIDQDQRAAAEQFATTVFAAWDRGEAAQVLPLLSEEMQAGFTSRQQREFAEDHRELFGAFRALAFVEVQRSVADGILVYRFKGSFAKKDGWEVRVVYDAAGKVAGFWAKPWKEQL